MITLSKLAQLCRHHRVRVEIDGTEHMGSIVLRVSNGKTSVTQTFNAEGGQPMDYILEEHVRNMILGQSNNS